MIAVYVVVLLADICILAAGWCRYGRTNGLTYGGARLLCEWVARYYPISARVLEQQRRLEVATETVLLERLKERRILVARAILLVVLALAVLGIVLVVRASMQVPDTTVTIAREEYGGESQEVDLYAQLDEETTEQVTMTVSPRQYREEELNRLFEEAFAKGFQTVLGENPSFQQVSKPLQLADTLDGYPFALRWWWEEERYVEQDGQICFDAFDTEQTVTLYLELSYEDDVRLQSQDIILVQPVMSQQEKLLQAIEQQLQQVDAKQPYDASVEVPLYVEDTKLVTGDEQNPSILPLALLVLIPLLLVWKEKQDVQTKLKNRREQILTDYPQLVDKLVLYLGAGMTIKNCFIQIVKESGDKRNRYLYSELSAMVQQLYAGVSELSCYEQWGARMEESVYIRLVTLLSQNLSKGTSGLLPALRQELADARQQRRARAKIYGEEAGTKLLLPMMLLLLSAMMIVMIPAFMSF